MGAASPSLTRKVEGRSSRSASILRAAALKEALSNLSASTPTRSGSGGELSLFSSEGTEHGASPLSHHPHLCRRRCRVLGARSRLWRRLAGGGERRLLHDPHHDDHAERSGGRSRLLPLDALSRRADLTRPLHTPPTGSQGDPPSSCA